MPRAKKSQFKQRIAQLEYEYGPVERGVWFWLAHVLHWNLALLAIVAVLSYAYLFLDRGAPVLAKVVSP